MMIHLPVADPEVYKVVVDGYFDIEDECAI